MGAHPPTDLLCPQAVELTAFKASGVAPTSGGSPFPFGVPTPPQPHCTGMEVIREATTADLPQFEGLFPSLRSLLVPESPPLAPRGLCQ